MVEIEDRVKDGAGGERESWPSRQPLQPRRGLEDRSIVTPRC
jgi:hypothetical protein